MKNVEHDSSAFLFAYLICIIVTYSYLEISSSMPNASIIISTAKLRIGGVTLFIIPKTPPMSLENQPFFFPSPLSSFNLFSEVIILCIYL